MNEKKKYEAPKLEVIEFELEDSIAASGNGAIENEELFGGW